MDCESSALCQKLCNMLMCLNLIIKFNVIILLLIGNAIISACENKILFLLLSVFIYLRIKCITTMHLPSTNAYCTSFVLKIHFVLQLNYKKDRQTNRYTYGFRCTLYFCNRVYNIQIIYSAFKKKYIN
jgi:hypothetical protein